MLIAYNDYKFFKIKLNTLEIIDILNLDYKINNICSDLFSKSIIITF